MFMANQRRRTDFIAAVDRRLDQDSLSEDLRG
jgi:pyruvate-ferredoxin/flavodoxin oxidoreductase